MSYAIPNSASVAELLDMLTYCRPAGGATEKLFIDKYIMPLDPEVDDYGNLWVQVGKDPNILWSCHTDTMHHKDGRQFVKVDPETGLIELAKKKVGRCLGADDGAGCWLLIQMIRADIPGLYVFHREEERGGQGSSWVAYQAAHLLEGIQMAVAFDRKGYDNIITHQMGQRCCSELFARQLGSLLGKDYMPDSSGTFTDTANYADIISECTNVSVGYAHEHGPMETLDLPFIVSLRDKLIQTDFSGLTAHRDPSVVEWDDWGDSWVKTYRVRSPMVKLVEAMPEEIAAFLEGLGYTANDVEDAMWDRVHYRKHNRR